MIVLNNVDVRAGTQVGKKQELYGDVSSIVRSKLGLRGMGMALGSEEIVSDRERNRDIRQTFFRYI